LEQVIKAIHEQDQLWYQMRLEKKEILLAERRRHLEVIQMRENRIEEIEEQLATLFD
jgi:hypothetical protein